MIKVATKLSSKVSVALQISMALDCLFETGRAGYRRWNGTITTGELTEEVAVSFIGRLGGGFGATYAVQLAVAKLVGIKAIVGIASVLGVVAPPLVVPAGMIIGMALGGRLVRYCVRSWRRRSAIKKEYESLCLKYVAFGVVANATDEQMRKAFRKAMRQSHPDKQNNKADSSKCQEVNSDFTNLYRMREELNVSKLSLPGWLGCVQDIWTEAAKAASSLGVFCPCCGFASPPPNSVAAAAAGISFQTKSEHIRCFQSR
eukprot:g43998.t1